MVRLVRYVVLSVATLIGAMNMALAAGPLSVVPNKRPNSSYALKALDYTKITGLEVSQSGRLWASVLAGGENAKGFTLLFYSDNEGKSWSAPRLALDGRIAGYSVRNGVLWLAPNGHLHLFYTVFDGYYDGRGSMWFIVCENPDAEAPQWGEPQYIGAGVCSSQPVVSNNGDWVMPVARWGRSVMSYSGYSYIMSAWQHPEVESPYARSYRKLDKSRGYGAYYSSDEGASWRGISGKIKTPEAVKARYNNPSIFKHADGSLNLVARTSGTAWAYIARSNNHGRSWSKSAQKFIHNPDHNFVVRNLEGGPILMVKNNRFDLYRFWQPHGLYAYLSDDYGKTWYGGLRVDTRSTAYDPVVALGKDGKIYIAYNVEPYGKNEIQLITTSYGEIDAATADLENNPKMRRQILAGGQISKRVAAEHKATYGAKKKWGSKPLRVATYNIKGTDKRWKSGSRQPALYEILDKYKFDIFGSQEPHIGQIEEMIEQIGGEYSVVGEAVGDNANPRLSHYNPIFYRTSRFEVLDTSTIWFAEKRSGKGYGAYQPRSMTWAKFRDKENNKVFYVFNSHYDHIGAEARVAASYVVLEAVRRVAKGMPAILTGDMNLAEGTEGYNVLLDSPILNDAMLAVSEPINAQYRSCVGYRPVTKATADGMHIDHIFFTPHAVRVQHWQLVTETHNGNPGSDHQPIFIDCKIAN